jgi:hypothetical protein
MPVRKVSNRGGNIIGHFPSLKLGRMVAFESLLERDFIYLPDYESGVEHFSEQPLIIKYQHGGKRRQYTPDFHVLHGGHNLLFECKPIRFVDDPDNQIKFEAARLWCQEQKWVFGIVTDERLASNWRIKNIKLLTQFAHFCFSVLGAWAGEDVRRYASSEPRGTAIRHYSYPAYGLSSRGLHSSE